MKDVKQIVANAQAYVQRARLRQAERYAASLPRKAIVREISTRERNAQWHVVNWYLVHCAHDKLFSERCAMCKRTTQDDIALALRSMVEVLQAISKRKETK
jgi:hypothetical protein